MRAFFTVVLLGALAWPGGLAVTAYAEDTPITWSEALIVRSAPTQSEANPVVIAESTRPVSALTPCGFNELACDEAGALPHYQSVWGVVGVRLFPDGRKMAPNGEPFHPVTSLDLDFNVWLWKRAGLYAFGDMRFWGKQDDDQPFFDGPNNSGHSTFSGAFNLSKREFDLTIGGAWNYCGNWKRAFAYSLSNLNRGYSLNNPIGFNDGVALENRYYLNSEYANLGHEGFDVSRATFVSIGYYPSKVMVDLESHPFAPGAFVRAYLTYDLPSSCCIGSWTGYFFNDTQLICNNKLTPTLLEMDTGLAVVPIADAPLFELRAGVELELDNESGSMHSNALPYLSVRLNY